MDDLEGDMELVKNATKNATKTRKTNLENFMEREADLTSAIDALQLATQTLKASRGGSSFVQLQSVAPTIETAMLMADAMGISSMNPRVASFLQDPPENGNAVEMENYNFSSNDVIDTLENLTDVFRKNKTNLTQEEAKSVAAYELFVQNKTATTMRLEQEFEDKKEDKSRKAAEIAKDSEELTTTRATLLEDKQYFTVLSKMCSNRAKTWDQRTRVRADELQALATVLTIVKGTVSSKTSGGSLRFAQQRVSVRIARGLASNEDRMEAIEAQTEEAYPDETPSLLQLVKDVQAAAKGPDAGKQAVLTLLRQKAMSLKSAMLSSLVTEISKDKFGKIKTLIQELIDRLTKEAANESEQKGFCDKAQADAARKRDHAADKIKELNGDMSKLESRRDTLIDEMDVLTDEIKELNDAKTDTIQERLDESTENNATIAEAVEGLYAVKNASKILSDFVANLSNNSLNLSFVQMLNSPMDDAPDAGFEEGEEYKGASSKSSGVVAMLDVVMSDFVRTIEVTQKTEAQAAQDHIVFIRKTDKSITEKTDAKQSKKRQKDDADADLSEDEGTLDDQSDLLESAIKELLELKPVCVETGMSYEDRVARREEEMEALTKALCLLNNYGENANNNGVSTSC